MGIEDSFFKAARPAESNIDDSAKEKQEGTGTGIWEKTKARLEKFGFSFSSAAGEEKKEEILASTREIEGAEEKYDHLFLETEFEQAGKLVQYKAVAQQFEGYDSAYKIDYAKEDPNIQKEAERLLLREAIIVEKMAKYSPASVSADQMLESQTVAGKDMYFLKTSLESSKEARDFGYEEGQQMAATLISLQHEIPASKIVNEIMAEQKYANQYELENEFSEDVFNDFDGYVENSSCKIDDRVEDGVIDEAEASRIKAEMEKYRSLIEAQQLDKDEYCLVFNQEGLDNAVVGDDGKIFLKDWNNIGTTQNKELALVNDLGLALESAQDSIGDKEQRSQFSAGLKNEVIKFYSKKDKGEEIAKAIIDLVELRTGIDM